jgi:hypothetical protein
LCCVVESSGAGEEVHVYSALMACWVSNYWPNLIWTDVIMLDDTAAFLFSLFVGFWVLQLATIGEIVNNVGI